MPASQKRSEQRQADILAAALSCFAERGVAKTTMSDICRRAGSSVGSLYHHFQSKEQLAATLYLSGVAQVQRQALAELRAHEDAESAVRALAVSYLDFVQAQPAFARFLLSERHAEFMALAESALRDMGREFRDAVRGRLACHVHAGVLRDLSPAVYSALLVGPSEHLARQWLAGRIQEGLGVARRQLSDAVWFALSAS